MPYLFPPARHDSGGRGEYLPTRICRWWGDGPVTSQMLSGAATMTDLSITILAEKPEDAGPIEALHDRTFGPGRYARTAYRIREKIDHRLDLSFTARIGTLLVGSVWLTPVRIGTTPALLLGPLTIEPPFRERGIRQALMVGALENAKEK